MSGSYLDLKFGGAREWLTDAGIIGGEFVEFIGVDEWDLVNGFLKKGPRTICEIYLPR